MTNLTKTDRYVKFSQVGQERAVVESVNLYDAKTNLSQLVDRAAAGEEIIIAKSGRPMARLMPLQVNTAPRLPGALQGQITIGADFDAPLPEEIIRGFYGDPS